MEFLQSFICPSKLHCVIGSVVTSSVGWLRKNLTDFDVESAPKDKVLPCMSCCAFISTFFGFVVSTTVTSNVPESESPEESVTVQDTTVVPILNIEPEGGLQIGVG